MAAFSGTWWELAIYRFLTALGIGGEWAAGAALVAEVWPEQKRTKAAGILQSAWAAGFLLAAMVNLLMRNHGWRPIFLIGIVPAIIALLVRVWVKEPERWTRAKIYERLEGTASQLKLAALFNPELLRSTLVGSGLAFVAVFGLWGATNWTPTLVRSLPDFHKSSPNEVTAYVSYATMTLNAGSLVGYLSFGPIADRVGRRGAFAVMCLGSLAMLPATFLTPHSYSSVLFLLPLLGFFNNGIFSGFAIYLPELFPTRLRATGAGFCFNVGRVLAATGPLVTGSLVGFFGDFGRAASAIALIYMVGLLILPFAPETMGRPLPP
jgi:MFS family permease